MEETYLTGPKEIFALKKEADQFTAIFTAIGKTVTLNQKSSKK
jgi:hypothetical protein